MPNHKKSTKSTPNHKKINEIHAKSKKKSTKSTPNHQKINEIDAKSTKNQWNPRQLNKKSKKSTPNQQKINEIDAKSAKNQRNRCHSLNYLDFRWIICIFVELFGRLSHQPFVKWRLFHEKLIRIMTFWRIDGARVFHETIAKATFCTRDPSFELPFSTNHAPGRLWCTLFPQCGKAWLGEQLCRSAIRSAAPSRKASSIHDFFTKSCTWKATIQAVPPTWACMIGGTALP